MERLDYLVIYHDNESIHRDSREQVPISIILRKESDAEEKLESIEYRLRKVTEIIDFTIIGIFKL